MTKDKASVWDDEECEVVASQVKPEPYQAKIFDNLEQVRDTPTFLSHLINACAQYATDKKYGEGTWENMSQEERNRINNEAGEYICALRDLGHLYN